MTLKNLVSSTKNYNCFSELKLSLVKMRPCVSLLTFLLCSVPIVVEGDEDKLFDERNERYSSSTVGLLKLLKVEQQFTDTLIKYAVQLGEKSQSLHS